MVKVQRLSDGRIFTALPKGYDQPSMFGLAKKCKLYNPQVDGIIANLNQLDDALNNSKVYNTVLGYGMSRSNQIAFYKPGFEKAYTQIGKKIVWVEGRLDRKSYRTEKLLVAILDLSEISKEKVRLADGKETSLQQAEGMGVIPISKLTLTKTEKDSKMIVHTVTVTSTFDPKVDLKVKKVVAQSGWSELIDSDGYPLEEGEIPNGSWGNENARFLAVHDFKYLRIIIGEINIEQLYRKLGVEPVDLGWFGSVTRCGGNSRYIYANYNWSLESAIPLVKDYEATTALQK